VQTTFHLASSSAALQADVAEHLHDLTPDLEAWDHLAVLTGQPYCAPGWMLPWWRHVVPQARHRLRIVLVHEGGRLVGLAPFYAKLGFGGLAEYRQMGTGHRVGPLAVPGREADVAQAVAHALAQVQPHPTSINLGRIDARSQWPTALCDHWPGRPPAHRLDLQITAPTLGLPAGGFDAWLGTKSGNFRQQTRRMRRRLEKAGAMVRMSATPEELRADLASLERLHRARWDSRGESGALSPGMVAMLHEAAHRLPTGERFRLFIVEIDGRAIGAQLFVAAGGEAAYWNGGFDPDWSDHRPGLVALLAAIEDAFNRADRRVDFGGGDHHYKRRLADRDEPVAFVTLMPRSGRYALTRAQMAPGQAVAAARGAAKRLPDPVQNVLRQAARRAPFLRG
jgi:CelD/BcsL family acetyltransferase involved in cellulose biosynthesis